MYSYFALHKLNATTALEPNRSHQDRLRVLAYASSTARFKVVVDLISRTNGRNQELTIDAERYRPEKIDGHYALPFMPFNN